MQFVDGANSSYVLDLSKGVEGKLDVEKKDSRKKQKYNKKYEEPIDQFGAITADLELNGRRLVVMEAMNKNDAQAKI